MYKDFVSLLLLVILGLPPWIEKKKEKEKEREKGKHQPHLSPSHVGQLHSSIPPFLPFTIGELALSSHRQETHDFTDLRRELASISLSRGLILGFRHLLYAFLCFIEFSIYLLIFRLAKFARIKFSFLCCYDIIPVLD